MISCIVIDDEPLALEQLKQYAAKTPLLDCRGAFDTASDALDFLRESSVDLLFVDINMPHISGIEFVESLPFDIKVVFITAYREYAIEGYALDAADYLLKPLSYSAFLKSVEKIHLRYFSQNPQQRADRGYMFVRSEYRSVRVNFDEIEYIESKREYLDIHLDSENVITTYGSLSGIEERLPKDRFVRVHRSFIVNLDQIKVIERNSILFGKQYIPINEQAKDRILALIKG